MIAYPFTDLSNTKVRPALIVRDQLGEDLICLPISSVFRKTVQDLELTDDDARGFAFPIKSVVRASKIFTLDVRLVRKKLGSLKPETYRKIKSALLDYLR